MPTLTSSQKAALKRSLDELFPRRKTATAPPKKGSLKKWWTSRADRFTSRMLRIDRDQMRSAAESWNRWVR